MSGLMQKGEAKGEHGLGVGTREMMRGSSKK